MESYEKKKTISQFLPPESTDRQRSDSVLCDNMTLVCDTKNIHYMLTSIRRFGYQDTHDERVTDRALNGRDDDDQA